MYKKFTDNYYKRDIESRKLTVKVAREFVQKYENDPDAKDIIKYFKAYIPDMERVIQQIDAPCYFRSGLLIPSASGELKNLYIKLLDCSRKTDLENRKSCVALAQEFIQKAEEEHLTGEQIDEVKKYIQRTEKVIKIAN